MNTIKDIQNKFFFKDKYIQCNGFISKNSYFIWKCQVISDSLSEEVTFKYLIG